MILLELVTSSMAEELSSLYEDLYLTKAEKQEILITQEEILLSRGKSKRCVVALVVAEKKVNKGAFRATMGKVWKAVGHVFFKDLGFNEFLVEFQSIPEKTKVLSGHPWSFDRFLVCLHDCIGCLAPKDFSFSMEPF